MHGHGQSTSSKFHEASYSCSCTVFGSVLSLLYTTSKDLSPHFQPVLLHSTLHLTPSIIPNYFSIADETQGVSLKWSPWVSFPTVSCYDRQNSISF